jgi:hypothetical protein
LRRRRRRSKGFRMGKYRQQVGFRRVEDPEDQEGFWRAAQ